VTAAKWDRVRFILVTPLVKSQYFYLLLNAAVRKDMTLALSVREAVLPPKNVCTVRPQN
jgi:hypothetical protein